MLNRLRIDPFLLMILIAVSAACFAPCSHQFLSFFEILTSLLVMGMFFLQGARLEWQVLKESIQNWRLQLLVLLSSYLLFPLMGDALYHLFFSASVNGLAGKALWGGILFLCCLPSTVQSSIALTSMARGNVAAAICAASLSNLIGIIVTPILVGIVVLPKLGIQGASPDLFGPQFIHAVIRFSWELFLPFMCGQIAGGFIGKSLRKHKKLLSFCERGSIALMIYTAFSMAVLGGVWHQLSGFEFASMVGILFLLLGGMLSLTFFLAWRMKGMDFSNAIAIQFCGSKKALSSGIPMANALFGAQAGIMSIPLLFYHQFQIFLCALLAKKYTKRPNLPLEK
ncbi:bile acid:sodium symporter [Acetobacteraceae bacterium]|nr:bile acid:sodium symporter [Acetobacteraceae bacterium]